ncbi:alpha/beta fold hydrolase [Pararhizobium gei]|uniref:alpha/beta fold hydrolase n=1 Tax=Pararhizobium gei TaxID=1395951 RepID=UPI0023DCB552|nr:alpha/beta fold hydrolase [Rhizobium gei]
MRLSTVHLAFPVLLALAIIAGHVSPASSAPLKPFKDDLFSYGQVLETADGGDYRVVEYEEMRDINGRDQVPERRVKRAYVSLGVKGRQANETIDFAGRRIDVTRVGDAEGARFSVVFIHGRGGDRRLGANDWSFGGNFNRVKNLAVANDGVYYAVSARSFDTAGVADLAALVSYAQSRSPQKPVIVACASMGSFLCWGLTRDAQAVAMLKGMIIMGGAADPSFPRSAAYRSRLPIYFTHGSADSVYPAADQIGLYRSLKSARYPSRFVLFQTGSHGTPVRMTDWKDALNWIGLD